VLAARDTNIPVEPFPPMISVIVDPPSPVMSDDGDEMLLRFSEDTMNRREQPVKDIVVVKFCHMRIMSKQILWCEDVDWIHLAEARV
jgi:hypothetical protein